MYMLATVKLSYQDNETASLSWEWNNLATPEAAMALASRLVWAIWNSLLLLLLLRMSRIRHPFSKSTFQTTENILPEARYATFCATTSMGIVTQINKPKASKHDYWRRTGGPWQSGRTRHDKNVRERTIGSTTTKVMSMMMKNIVKYRRFFFTS